MQVSLIICTRNRAAQLGETLHSLLGLVRVPDSFEVVMVDTNSTDGTQDVMSGFAAEAPWPCRVVNTCRRGLSVARNTGILAARGEWLVFTDDDCLVDSEYFTHLIPATESARFQYGAGGVILHDPRDAAIGVSPFKRELVIPPRSVVPPGMIHGANFFFHRAVFEQAGMFHEYPATAASLLAEDVEMTTRASLHGFTGVLFPAAFVRHHHRRRPNTPELDQTFATYEKGGGGYYAALLAEGHVGALKHWAERTCQLRGQMTQRRLNERLQREFQSAAEFLARWLADTQEERASMTPILPRQVTERELADQLRD